MRLLLVSLFAGFGALYAALALRCYREERSAQSLRVEAEPGGFTHPEANLRLLREAIETSDVSDRLLPHLERSLEQAPSSYQPPLLMAAFYANRLERPELVARSFEAALARFPSNGRLHLSYAEWLLTPRPTAPYRLYRRDRDSAQRAAALDHLGTATRLEPDLTRTALGLLSRFRIPLAEWTERLPLDDETSVLVLHTLDRTEPDPETRRRLLQDGLAGGSTPAFFGWLSYYGEKWGEPEIALEAASRWRAEALDAGLGGEIARATAALARHHLSGGRGDRAYEILRETLAAIEERSLPAESALELLCLSAEDYLARRQTAMAQALFSEAVALSRFHVPAFLGLARTHRTAGDLESAREQAAKALEIDPSNEQARRLLQELTEQSPGASEG